MKQKKIFAAVTRHEPAVTRSMNKEELQNLGMLSNTPIEAKHTQPPMHQYTATNNIITTTSSQQQYNNTPIHQNYSQRITTKPPMGTTKPPRGTTKKMITQLDHNKIKIQNINSNK